MLFIYTNCCCVDAVYRYCVAFFTSNVMNSGQKPLSIFITIHGERGDTGRRPLTVSKTQPIPFVGDQVDVFFIPAVNLGKLSRVVVDVVSETPSTDDLLYIHNNNLNKQTVVRDFAVLVISREPCQVG